VCLESIPLKMKESTVTSNLLEFLLSRPFEARFGWQSSSTTLKKQSRLLRRVRTSLLECVVHTLVRAVFDFLVYVYL